MYRMNWDRNRIIQLRRNYPVLIAEDNLVSRRMLEESLKKTGHEVVAVENGKEALKLYESRFFPILLTDWVMPEMDGLQLCRAIRASMKESYVFIVLLTVKDSLEDMIRGLETGADDYLTKPFNHAELIARLNTAVRILELERNLKQANEEIRALSVRDPLTGAFNRGYLSERFPQEFERSVRYRRPLSLVMCDLDFFKAINDSHGHLAGDQVLRTFVQTVQSSFRRKVDWICRYGGEEFLIVLPETGLSGARDMAENLRKTVTGLVIPSPSAPDTAITLTASFGVTGIDASCRTPEISPEELLNFADILLYRAKAEGRNRVVAAPPDPPALETCPL